MPDRPAALALMAKTAAHEFLRDVCMCDDGPDSCANCRSDRDRLAVLLIEAEQRGVAAGREEAARIAEQHCEQSPHVDTGSMWHSSAATTIAAAIRRLYPR